MGKHFSKNSETQKFRNFGNLSLPIFEFLKFRNPGFLLIRNDESTFWIFEIQNSWIFDNYNMIIWWNHEKSKTRNLLTSIFPAEFLEKLGYEFSFDQKTWNTISQKRTNFSIFRQCNPYHQSTYRFPPCIRFLP